MQSGGQVGNRNAAKAKRWQKALERALARSSNQDTDAGLDEIADTVVASAKSGDTQAWKEIGDRMDGKVPQGLEHSGPDGDAIETKNALSVVFVNPEKPGE